MNAKRTTPRTISWGNVVTGTVLGAILGIGGTYLTLAQRIATLEERTKNLTPDNGSTPDHTDEAVAIQWLHTFPQVIDRAASVMGRRLHSTSSARTFARYGSSPRGRAKACPSTYACSCEGT